MSDTRKILIVDLSSRIWTVEQLEIPGLLGLGGKALGIRLLERYLNPAVDPLAPDNVLVITPSPVAAYSMSGSDRFGAFTKSPLTGIWLEAYCGGSFARTLRETGWDAVVIHGAADSPVRVHVDGEGIAILPAEELWGKDTFATEDILLSQLATRSAVLSIGVAGENLVAIASVMHQQAHALGRGGMGAVFGSKRLKAITVTSPGAMKREPGEQFVAARREIARLATDSPTAHNYNTYGTPVMVALLNETGAFPTDFFTKGAAPHRATLEAEHWRDWADIESDTCPPCPMRCRKRLTLTQGREKGRQLHQAEYETIYAFGGSCMVEHARDVAKLNERCNLLGLDSISAGNLAAIAIKGKELGLVSDGPAPGDGDAIDRLLLDIAHRSTPTGDILARGMDEALTRFGMTDLSITSKHLDPAGYEPRRLKGMALSYAVSVRGACHLRATFYKAELSGLLDGLDDEAFVDTYVDWENRMLIIDSLTMCRFYRDFLPWETLATIASQLNSAPVSVRELKALADDVMDRIRILNTRFGALPADDTVAERFFRQATDKAPALDREELARWVRIYWLKRGWTENGYVPEKP